MPTDARLLALPSLRKQAEEDAEEQHSALAVVLNRCDLPTQSPTMPAWRNIPPSFRDMRTDAQVALLADITRWQSQAWAVRRIGALVWQEEPDYVPELNQAELELERGKHTVCWVLGGKCYGHPLWNDSHIPGIGRMSRPEAIAAILLHVEEA